MKLPQVPPFEPTIDDCSMVLLDDSQRRRIRHNEGPRPSHCNHWYDEPDTPCCRCGDNTTDELADREDD